MAIPDDGIVSDTIPEAPSALAETVNPAPALPRFTATLTTCQALLGFVATVMSVGGTGLTLPKMLAATHGAGSGDMAIIVQDAKAGRVVVDANIEILTAEDALLTTLTSNGLGQAEHSLREGRYRVRVRHPRYAMHTQPVLIMKGQRTVVPVRLRDDVPSASPAGVGRRPAPSAASRLNPPPPNRPSPQAP